MADPGRDENGLSAFERMGYPKPANNPPTKHSVREVYRAVTMPHLKPIIEAAIARATGIQHFMLRDPATGEWRRLEDPAEIEAALNDPRAAAGSTYRIFTKDPDMTAIADLFNRTMDKPKEQPQELEAQLHHTFAWKKDEE